MQAEIAGEKQFETNADRDEVGDKVKRDDNFMIKLERNADA